MGKPLTPAATPAAATPPSGDQATQVVTGQFTAVGPSDPCVFFGTSNFALWASVNTTLTTTANSSAATVASGTGLQAGQTINSVNVPLGTTIGAIAGLNVTLAFPPGVTNAAVVGGADANALFNGIGATVDATVCLERSFDGGSTWMACGIGGGGIGGVYVLGGASGVTQPVNGTFTEPEQGVAYRFNCTIYNSGTINYRLSSSGHGATTANRP